MSDTDDTDILLLIPPDFFLVRSSGSEDSLLESSRTVVPKTSFSTEVIKELVSHVNSLEDRIESLENSTASDIVSTTSVYSSLPPTRRFQSSVSLRSDNYSSLDRKCSTFPKRKRRKVYAKRNNPDTSLTSFESDRSSKLTNIPLLNFNKSTQGFLKQKTDKSNVNKVLSMDGDMSSIASTPSKKNDKLLLNEIDEFLSKVETYESPETKNCLQECPHNVVRETGDYISQKLDNQDNKSEITLPSGRTVPSDFLDKYIYLARNPDNRKQQSDSTTKESSNFDKDSHSDVTPLKTTMKTTEPKNSIRKLNFTETNRLESTSTPKKPQTHTSNLDNFKPSSNKIYDKATKVLEQYKISQSMGDTSCNTSFNYPQKFEYKSYKCKYTEEPKPEGCHRSRTKYPDSVDTDLLSLSELWGEQGQRTENSKLEEERLKREHCEAMIQNLQKKLLEQQERIAVAIKVDKAKDNAIAKLRDAWTRVTDSLDLAETKHKATIHKMTQEIENLKHVADEAHNKTKHFENELYKTLDLAHDYQEKCKDANLEKQNLQESLEKALKEKDDIISKKDTEIETLKDNNEAVMRLNKQSTDCIKNLESFLEKEKQEHGSTKSQIQELSKVSQKLQDEMNLIKQERDVLKNKVNEERSKCSILEKQLCDVQGRLTDTQRKEDSLDTELKNLRKHLELQKTELKSYYQKQLEEAVISKLKEFQQQLDAAEKDMEREGRVKENNLIDIYNKQINRIEEQHKLEIKVLEEKQKEEIKLYRLQLAQSSEKINLLENKLSSYKRRRGEIASQLHGVMEAQWRAALQILTNGTHTPADNTADTVQTMDLSSDCKPQGSSTQFPFNERPLAGSMMRRSEERRLLTPNNSLSDRLGVDGLSDTELQHYVKMLLAKPPDFLEGSGDGLQNHSSLESHHRLTRNPPDEDEPTSDRPDHQTKQKDKAKRSLNSLYVSKPPWKA